MKNIASIALLSIVASAEAATASDLTAQFDTAAIQKKIIADIQPSIQTQIDAQIQKRVEAAIAENTHEFENLTVT
jgi:hypothetical protein